jgi:hypothetical protein
MEHQGVVWMKTSGMYVKFCAEHSSILEQDFWDKIYAKTTATATTASSASDGRGQKNEPAPGREA